MDGWFDGQRTWIHERILGVVKDGLFGRRCRGPRTSRQHTTMESLTSSRCRFVQCKLSATIEKDRDGQS